MDFHHIMMQIHHKLYDSYKLYYCLPNLSASAVSVFFLSFFTLYPNLYALSLVGNTLLCKCASYTLVASHVWLSELSLHILTRLLTSGHCMTVFVCLSLVFVFVFCICFFVFVSVSVFVFVRPLSSSLSSFMLIIIIYLCNRNLSSPSSAPYTRILLLQNFSTNCQRL